MKIWKKLFLLTVALAVTVGLSACNLFVNDEEVVKNMMSQMSEIKSYAHETIMTGDVVAPTGENLLLDVNIKGENISPVFDENYQVTENGAFTYNFTGNLSASGVSNNFDLDLKMLDESMYIRVNSLPMLDMLGYSDMVGEWYSLNWSKAQELSGATENAAIDQTRFNELMAYVYELYDSNPIFTVTDDLGSAKVGEVSTYHYKLDVNKEKLVSFMTQLTNKMMKMEESVELSEEEQQELIASMEKMVETLNFDNIEFYIGKDDFLLYKSVIGISINTDTISDMEDGQMSFSLDSEYSNFNKVENINAPESSKSLEELFSGLMMSAAGNSNIDPEEINLEEDLTEEEQQMLDEFLQENPEIELK